MLLAMIVMLAGCGSEEGPDSLTSHTGTGNRITCVSCHSVASATRRQIVGVGGDFNRESHHVIDYSDRNNEIVTDDDCLVCHHLGNHGKGTIWLNDKDDPDQIIVYQPGDPASLEPFCLSCHDTDGATTEASPLSPFSSTSTLGTTPNRAGIEIAGSWNKQYGHRREGVTCLGSGESGTGCHGNYDSVAGTGSINAHGSGNVGLLANKLTLPITSAKWDETRYTLCLDCHRSETSLLTISELVGVAAGGNYAQPQENYNQLPYTVDFMVTGFHDYYSYGRDRQFNLHLYHLIEGMGQWYYRGGGPNGIPSCVACHNVHGVDGQYYYLWDEWGFSVATISGIDYGMVVDSNFSGTQYPDFCSFTCHSGSHFPGEDRYPRAPFNEAKASASTASGTLAHGDTVAISFSNSTNGAVIDESNIDSVLTLSGGHSWVDSLKGGTPPPPGELTADWSHADGKTNNVLTITIYIDDSSAGDPSIAVDDGITFDASTITDLNGTPVRGTMTLLGSF
ncbi:MAG TPA: hypothetical protein DCO77_10945 [Nitrospiraceae bacterium]|nr:hypothetical protein [Nitrospiraceae bacterium]